MNSSRFALTALVLFLSLALYPGSPDVAPTGPKPLDRQLEVARLRAHFDSVDLELRAANALQLTPAQRTARVTLIGWLREYRDAGAFPRNDRFPNRAMPFFRDGHGVLCAMAYLIERSGRGDLVDRVAATRNNASIAELAGDGELLAWLDSTGLSVAEAARIQPFYGTLPENEDVSTEYAVTSIVVSGASLATLGFNLFAPSRTTGWAGVAAGSAAIIAGAVNLDETGGTDDVATVNIIAGGSALVAGIYQLLRLRPEEPANTGVSVAPTVTPASGGPRIGLALHTSF
ncbi:MAG TPA: hypothetical protein VIT87_02530 [Gemmatimonadales bacterium]